MLFVVIVALLAILVWGTALVRHLTRQDMSIATFFALLTLLAGVVVGYEFFNADLGPIPITIDRLMLLVTVGLFAALVLLGYEQLQAVTKVDLLVLGFIGFATLSTLFHDWSYRGNLPLSRLLFFNLLPVAVYTVVRNSQLATRDLMMISGMFAVLGCYLAVTAVGECLGWSWLVYPGYILSADFTEFLGRGRGPMLNPVSNGIFMTVSLCSLLMWWSHVGLRWRVVIMLAVPLLMAGISATLTRSVWLAAAMSVGLLIWLPMTGRARGASLALAAAIVLICIPFAGESLSSFKRDKYVSVAEMKKSAELRPLFMIVAWRMLQNRPLLGHGYGQYTQAKLPFLQDPTSTYPLYKTKPFIQHNVILSYLTELGLIGTGLFLLLIAKLSWISWRLWKRASSDLWTRQFGLLTLVVLGVHLVNGMFHDVSIIPMGNMLLFFFAGVATRLYFAVDRGVIETGQAEDRGPTVLANAA